MKKIISLSLALFLVVVSFSGCAKTTLSDMSIVEGVGVDYENGIKLSLQYLDLAKGTGVADNLDGNITKVSTGFGNDISMATSNASSSLSGSVFLGQNRIIVFGKDFAKNGIDLGIDYVLQAVDSRPDVPVVICSSSAEKLISSKENDSKIPAQSIYEMLQTGEENGYSVFVTVNDLLNNISSKTSDVFLPLVSVDNEKAYCDGIALFSSEKYVSSFDENETLGFLLINDKIQGATVIAEEENLGTIGVEITKSKSKKSVYISDDTLTFNVDLSLSLALNETENKISSKLDENDISKAENAINKKVEELCYSAVQKAFDNSSDVFMLGNMLSRNDYSSYEKYVDSWHSILPLAKAKISVTSKLEIISDNQSNP